MIPLNLKLKKKRQAIFLDAYQENSIGSNYSKIINQIFNILKYHNFDVIVKKHANVPLSDCFKNIKKNKLISSIIPIELYDLKNIDLVIGNSSIGQANVANLNSKIIVISCLLLFYNKKKMINENTKNLKSIYDFLSLKDLKKKIYFPKHINEIKKIIK